MSSVPQVGGTHYQSEYQHWDWMVDNFGPSYLVGYATKYLVRYRKKDLRLDVEKAITAERKLLSLYAPGGKFEHQLPRVAERVVNFPQFAKANGLEGDRVRIFHLLMGYTSVTELELAVRLTEKLLGEL